MHKLLWGFPFLLLALSFGMHAEAASGGGNKGFVIPGCAVSFGSAVNQFRQDGKIVPGSTNDNTVTSCKPVFQSMCGDAKAKAQAVAPASNSGAPNYHIGPKDVDSFCKTMK